MKTLKTYKDFINENISDYLKPKSEKDIESSIENASDLDVIQAVVLNRMDYKLLPPNSKDILIDAIHKALNTTSGRLYSRSAEGLGWNLKLLRIKDSKHEKISKIDENGIGVYDDKKHINYEIPYRDLGMIALIVIAMILGVFEGVGDIHESYQEIMQNMVDDYDEKKINSAKDELTKMRDKMADKQKELEDLIEKINSMEIDTYTQDNKQKLEDKKKELQDTIEKLKDNIKNFEDETKTLSDKNQELKDSANLKT